MKLTPISVCSVSRRFRLADAAIDLAPAAPKQAGVAAKPVRARDSRSPLLRRPPVAPVRVKTIAYREEAVTRWRRPRSAAGRPQALRTIGISICASRPRLAIAAATRAIGHGDRSAPRIGAEARFGADHRQEEYWPRSRELRFATSRSTAAREGRPRQRAIQHYWAAARDPPGSHCGKLRVKEMGPCDGPAQVAEALWRRCRLFCSGPSGAGCTATWAPRSESGSL